MNTNQKDNPHRPTPFLAYTIYRSWRALSQAIKPPEYLVFFGESAMGKKKRPDTKSGQFLLAILREVEHDPFCGIALSGFDLPPLLSVFLNAFRNAYDRSTLQAPAHKRVAFRLDPDVQEWNAHPYAGTGSITFAHRRPAPPALRFRRQRSVCG